MFSDKSYMGQEMKNSFSGKNLKLWEENKIQQKLNFLIVRSLQKQLKKLFA